MKNTIPSVITSCLFLTSLTIPSYGACCFNQDAQAAAVQKSPDIKGATLVRTGSRSGYYVASPESPLQSFGLHNIGYIDSDNVSRNGVGQDVIVFKFGTDGKLEGFPVYVSQLAPESFYTTRLRGVSPGNSTLHSVQELFAGESLRVEKQGAGTVAYVAVPVYNPLTTGS